jgi:membrane protein implicated in regulation of membrane protease activity
MKQYSLWISLLAVAMIFSSCDLVGDIFQAGFYAAFIVIGIVVIIIIWLFSKFRRRR